MRPSIALSGQASALLANVRLGPIKRCCLLTMARPALTLRTTILTRVPNVTTLLSEMSRYSRLTTPVRTRWPQWVRTARELEN